MTVLLVTGSRSLARRPEGAAWARGLLREAVEALPAGSVLVTGDADGPDRWAVGAAWSHEPELWVRVYHLSGSLACFYHQGHVTSVPGWFSWCAEGAVPEPDSPEWRRWPLERDRAMVKAVAAMQGDRLCLALIDAASRTRGTEYTARVAESAGIAVRREVFRA